MGAHSKVKVKAQKRQRERERLSFTVTTPALPKLPSVAKLKRYGVMIALAVIALLAAMDARTARACESSSTNVGTAKIYDAGWLLFEDGSLLPPQEEDDPQWDCSIMGNKICGNSPEGSMAK